MKKHIHIGKSILFFWMVVISICAIAQTRSVYLPPPTNLQAQAIGGIADITWDKPVDTVSGTTPAGLLGYRLYVWDTYNNSIWDPDSLEYYFYLDFEDYKFTLTAVYDMTPYGQPGDTAESWTAGPVYIYVACPVELPFSEPWDMGSFDYQEWKFEPSMGNWGMSTSSGNPLPTAFFSSEPVQTNYSYLMKSVKMCTYGFLCADYFLDFDLALDDSLMNGTEKMIVQIYFDSTWHEIATYQNIGNIGWTTEHLVLQDVNGVEFKIGFSAEGINSKYIEKWSIDNIKIYLTCHPARDPFPEFNNDGHVVLRWQKPECPDPSPDTLNGISYNVYRLMYPSTNFQRVNSEPLHDTVFIDTTVIPGSTYDYYIGALQKCSYSGSKVCEPHSDTLTNIYIGIENRFQDWIKIFPSPADDWIFVQGVSSKIDADLYDMTGRVKRQYLEITNKIPVHDVPDGIYILKLWSAGTSFAFKVVIQH